MATFDYTARNKQGEKQSGRVEAASADEAAQGLLSKGFIPIDIVKFNSGSIAFEFKSLSRPPTQKDLIVLCGQLYSLTKAGVSIVNAIKVAHDICDNKQLKHTLQDIMQRVSSGVGLAQVLRQHTNIFSPLFVSLVEIGENTGKIHESFLQIKIYLEKDLQSRRKLKAAIRYPMIVVIAVLIAIVIINVFVVPSFMDFFEAYHAELPLPTKILIGCSKLFTHYGLYIVFLLAGFTFLAVLKAKTQKGKLFFARLVLMIPWLGKFVERTLFSRFCRCFGMVLQAEVPLLTGLHIVSDVLNNPILNQKIQIMRSNIQNGESLIQAARTSTLFPPLVMQMLVVGENTGELDVTFYGLADHYDIELDYEIGRVGEIIEPILIIIIAFMVLILALGVFLPMWDMSTVAFGSN